MRLGNKKQKNEQEDSNRWMFTYSDMITLLLVFFVLLYSMSLIDLEKFQETARGFSIIFGSGESRFVDEDPTAFGGQLMEISAAPVVVFERFVPPVIEDVKKIGEGWEIGEKAAAEEPQEDDEELFEETMFAEVDSELLGIARGLKERIDGEGLQEEVTILIEGGRLVIRIQSEGVLFESGSADLKEEIIELLDIIAESLQFYRGLIMVEGHTDNVPIHTPRFPSNWELSTARAVSVLKYWIDQEMILPGDVVAAGYADTKPIETNETEEGRAQNRRVEILVLSRDEAKTLTR